MSYFTMGAMIASALVSARASQIQGQTAQKIGRNNQIMAEYAAQDAEKRGDEQASQLRQKAAQLKGAQRANMAAKGLDLTEGTPDELLTQTDFFSELDQKTAKDNAARDAWAKRVGGANAAAQGDAAKQQGNLAAFSTVLSAAGSVSGKWGQMAGTDSGWNGSDKGMFAGAKSGDVGY